MARLYNWLTDPQRNPKIIGSRLNDEFDNIFNSQFALPTSPISVNRNGVSQTGLTAGAANKIQFNNVVLDTDGAYDGVTNFRYQPRVSGRYLFDLTILANANSVDTPQAEIFKNGSQAIGGTYLSSGAGTGTYIMSVSGVLNMNGTTDYAEFFVYVPIGITTLNGAVANTNATAQRIG